MEIADMARVRANQAVVGDSYYRPQSYRDLSRGRLCLGLWVYVYQRGVQYEYLLESIVSLRSSKIAAECGELMSLAAWPCFGCAFRRISSLSAQSVRINRAQGESRYIGVHEANKQPSFSASRGSCSFHSGRVSGYPFWWLCTQSRRVSCIFGVSLSHES